MSGGQGAVDTSLLSRVLDNLLGAPATAGLFSLSFFIAGQPCLCWQTGWQAPGQWGGGIVKRGGERRVCVWGNTSKVCRGGSRACWEAAITQLLCQLEVHTKSQSGCIYVEVWGCNGMHAQKSSSISQKTKTGKKVTSHARHSLKHTHANMRHCSFTLASFSL